MVTLLVLNVKPLRKRMMFHYTCSYSNSLQFNEWLVSFINIIFLVIFLYSVPTWQLKFLSFCSGISEGSGYTLPRSREVKKFLVILRINPNPLKPPFHKRHISKPKFEPEFQHTALTGWDEHVIQWTQACTDLKHTDTSGVNGLHTFCV